MPALSALDAMREHIEVIGLAYDDIEPAAMKAFLKKHPVSYPIAIVDVYAAEGFRHAPRLADDLPHRARRQGGQAFPRPGRTARDIEAAIAAAGGGSRGRG
jgi:hypothetical protein